METVPAPTQEDPGSPDTVKNEDGSCTHGGGRASPPPNCAICLGTCRNKSFTDSCLHQFCFKCLLTWSKVKAVCPLCKQNFRSIIHNVRSNHQYEEYMVEQRNNEESSAQRTFRYSTTITVPRHESIAIQQLLLQHYPLISNILPVASRRRRSPSVFRRTVYRHNLWARPLPDFTGRFRDCNPDFYRYNDSQMHRLMPWIRRELIYLLNDNQGHISYVMSRILELLPQYHIHSTEFKEAMQRYLGDRTEHFLHELYCFASTPYDMTGYDRHVQYTTDARVSTVINEVVTSSDSDASVDSDIVMISSSEPAEPAPGPSRPSCNHHTSYIPQNSQHPDSSQALFYPNNYIPLPADNNVIPIETISHSDTDDDSEVMVVGYIKPPQDRTPEIVDLLGSDSDVIVQDTPPSEPTQNEPSESRSGSLVKISLKYHKPRESNGSDSEDSTYTPPRPPRRRRRPRSADTATTVDTRRTTPSPASYDSQSTISKASTSSSSPSSSYSSSVSTSFGDLSSDSYEPSEEKRKISKRKIKRKRSSERSKKKCKRSKTRSHHKERKISQRNSDKSSKRKSYSGKGVKSSKAKVSVAQSSKLNTDQLQENLDQPVASTSGISSFKKNNSKKSDEVSRPNYESRRLKSVVRVIKRKKSTNLQSSKENELDDVMPKPNSSRLSPEDERNKYSTDLPHSSRHDSSESEDNLPLNLTIQKST